MKLLFKEESYQIIGAAMAVHNELGSGFLEAVYQEAFEIELQRRDIPFEREKTFTITYAGQQLNKTYTADFVCYGEIVVELKAISALNGDNVAQVINYLKCSGLQLGLLINFGEASLVYRRIPRSIIPHQ